MIKEISLLWLLININLLSIPFIVDSEIHPSYTEGYQTEMKYPRETTAELLRDEVKEWYNYNISNVDKDLTDEELKKYGGVCRHYSQWYTREFKKRGFKAKDIIIELDENKSHMFSVVSDSTGYCVADQTKVWCWGGRNG